MFSAGVAYLAFVLLALVGPGIAAHRLLRLKLDVALVLPAGLALCAAAYWLSLLIHPWLFPVVILALDLSLLKSRSGWELAEGPSLKGVLPAWLLLIAFLAATEFGLNRRGPRGEFVFDSVVPEDTTFHVALAWELTTGYPPQVPGLSGVPMGYHLGQPLVRAAALRWAGVHPYDQMSRFEIALSGLALALAVRAAAHFLGVAAAVVLVPWTLLATDFSFVFGGSPKADIWINLTDSNILFSIAHANSSITALAIALGALVAWRRARSEAARWWAPALLLSAAVPHFKAFVAAQFLFGLGIAGVMTRRWREALALAMPALVGLAGVVLGPASTNMEVLVDPLTIVTKLRHGLDLPPAHGVGWLGWTLAWVIGSLGLRILGVAPAARALRAAAPWLVALAAMALVGWPVGMLFRVTPLEFPGRPPYNEAWYFIEQSGPLLWIFAAAALVRRPLRGWLAWARLALAAALCLPSTLQFVAAKRRTPPVFAPPAVVESMAVLAQQGHAGQVVLMRPEPKRYPPPPMVLIGWRVPYSRFIPYLYQVAPPAELRVRLERVRAFFKAREAEQALEAARELNARYVCLFGDDDVDFPKAGVLRPVYEEDNARVFEIVDPRRAATLPPRR